MKQLETYIVQDDENKSWMWVFTSKEDAVEQVKDLMVIYTEDGEEILWEWHGEDECIVKLAGHEGDRIYGGDFYYIWKDSIFLSDEDIEKLKTAKE
jgi:hypothetical protein